MLPNYSDKNVSFVNVNSVNNHIVKESIFYSSGQLIKISKTVLNNADQLICYQEINTVNNSPILESTEKSFFDSNGEEKYSFIYERTGLCFMVHDKEYGDDILAANIGQPNVEFSWIGFEYYQNALPIVPF